MDFNNTMPIYLQVIRELKKEMIRGNLPLGAKLPSAREMAVQFQINPNTANRIYRELEMMELCCTKRGLGTFMTQDINKLKVVREEMAQEVMQQCMAEMKDLGYTKEEVLTIVENDYSQDNVKGV